MRTARMTAALLVVALLPVNFRAAISRSIGNQVSARQKKPAPAKTSPAKAIPVPFRLDEALDYRVSWSNFSTAGTVRLTIPEKREVSGWETWHFRAEVHTVPPVRTLFTIDDQFDSYTDVDAFESRQYETYLNELGKKENLILHFVPLGAATSGPGPFVAVLPGTRDPLGALYNLRATDWQKVENFTMPVSDGKNLYEMHAIRQNVGEKLQTSDGELLTTHLGIHLFDHGQEVSRIAVEVWLSEDPSRRPVLITAQLPFGSLRVEMIKSSSQ